MILNQQQALGSKCTDPYISPDFGFYSGHGVLTLQYGTWWVSGVLCGNGVVIGSGFGSFDGQFSGNAPGYQSSGPLDYYGNGLPYVTFSGNGNATGTPLVNYDNALNFRGRNAFNVDGHIDLSVVPSLFSGQGNFCFSGVGWINGYAVITGNAWGTGVMFGEGTIVHPLPFQTTDANCTGHLQGFVTSGDFTATGVVSGQNAVYKAMAQAIDFFAPGTPKIIGGGEYFNLEGIFSGFSARPFWGFGDVFLPAFAPGQIFYDSGAYVFGLAQGFWGTGYFQGNGIIRGESGFYVSYGTAKGEGYFSLTGVVSGLLGAQNIFSGSGSYIGKGSVFLLTSSGTISGLYCQTVAPTPITSTCNSFPPYVTNCLGPSSLALDFSANGLCVVQADHK